MRLHKFYENVILNQVSWPDSIIDSEYSTVDSQPCVSQIIFTVKISFFLGIVARKLDFFNDSVWCSFTRGKPFLSFISQSFLSLSLSLSSYANLSVRLYVSLFIFLSPLQIDSLLYTVCSCFYQDTFSRRLRILRKISINQQYPNKAFFSLFFKF